MIEVPYKAVFAKLKEEVRSQAARPPKSGEMLRLPVERIRRQLASGSVKVTFGELRQFSPAGVFNQNGHHEDELVELPLSELLANLKPEHLGRRAGQKKIEVPSDFDPVFGVGGANLRIAGSEKGGGAAAKPKPTASTIAEFKAKLAAQAQAQAVAAAATPEQVQAAPAPAIPAPGIPAPSSVSAAPISPIAPAAPIGNGAVEQGPIKAPALDPALAGGKKPGKNVLELPLNELAKRWKEEGKENLTALSRLTVELPMQIVESGLKRGKLVFAWSQFKGWIRAENGTVLPELGADEQIDLPLALVAPKFMGQHKSLRKQKKLTLSEEIPDVFGPKESASKEKAKPAAAPQTAAEVAPNPAPAPEAPSDFGSMLGQAGKENWSLQEMVQGCSKMPGVAGALIGTADGLLVASTWPQGVKADTVAAFLPQLHSRVNQFSNHLKLGETDNFALMVGDLPLQVFRTGNSYLIALGKPGENLPKPQLSAVAQRLSQTTPR